MRLPLSLAATSLVMACSAGSAPQTTWKVAPSPSPAPPSLATAASTPSAVPESPAPSEQRTAAAEPVSAPSGPTPLELAQKEGLTCSERLGQHGCVDRLGRVIVPFVFPAPIRFSCDGVAAVLVDVYGRTATVAAALWSDPSPDPPQDEASAQANAQFGLTCRPSKTGYGCTDASGRVVVPFFHHSPISFTQSGFALVGAPSYSYYVDTKYERRLRAQFIEHVPDASDVPVVRYQKDGKTGFLDLRRGIVTPPKFGSAFRFENGNALVCLGCSTQRWDQCAPREADCTGDAFLIDETGKRLSEDPDRDFGEYWWCREHPGKRSPGFSDPGYCGSAAERAAWALERRDEKTPLAQAKRDGLKCSERRGKHGCIDGTGRTIVPFIFPERIDFSDEGVARFYFDVYGRSATVPDGWSESSKPTTDDRSAEANARHGLSCSWSPSGYGCTDQRGRAVVPYFHTQPITFTQSGFALVHTPNANLYVDAKYERKLVALGVDGTAETADGPLVVYAQSGKVGILDLERGIVTPPVFDALLPFEQGKTLACVGCSPQRWNPCAPPETKCTGEAFLIDGQGRKLAEEPDRRYTEYWFCREHPGERYPEPTPSYCREGSSP